MQNHELQSLIDSEIRAALGGQGSELSTERAENLRYYLGEKFGNEQEGRSQVVSTDVADTIDWILPQLMRIFASGENTVAFEPVGPEDLEVAEQATQYVNHIWNQDNEGFLNFYTWFKDALLSKNGFIKIWWDEGVDGSRETWEALSPEELAFIASDPGVEIINQEEHFVESAPGAELVPVYNVTGIKLKNNGRVRVEPVPPEEFLISRDAKTIEDARFVGHRQRRTLSSLIEDGFPRDIIERLPSADDAWELEEETLARNTIEDSHFLSDTSGNRAMQEVWVTECYVRLDLDGDGIGEMRQITVVGPHSEVLRNVPWQGPRPFASLTPVVMPHRFYGRAVADLVKDIQLVKSTIMRQYLDGLYLANNPRQEAVEANIVEPAELLQSRPGGVIRVKERGSINPISTPFSGAMALEGLQYTDQVRENRTGVSPRTQGLGDNPMHQTAAGERMLFTAAQGKIELIARIFAETGVKRAFRLILSLVSRHQNRERIIKLRNNWVAMDPREWSEELNMRVSVGLGTGDKAEQMTNALALLELQKQAIEFGFATPQNLFETAEILVNAMGLKGADRFFTLPQDPQAASQPGVPGLAGAMGQQEDATRAMLEQQAMATQSQVAMQAQAVEADMQSRMAQQSHELQLKERELQHRMELDRMRIENDIQLKREKQAAELEIKRASQMV